MRRLLPLISLALAGCIPVAVTPGVKLDDVSASAYQAGRTQQAAQTADAATATSITRWDGWTATASARTEVYAAGRETLAAASYAATAAALTPTVTPIPTATRPPTATPAPTWTATPDATVAALGQETARLDRDNAAARGWVALGLGVMALAAGALALAYLAGRLWASFEYHMGRARRERYLFAGSDVLDMASAGWVERPAVTVIESVPARAVDEPAGNAQVVAEAARTAEWRSACLRIALWAHQMDDDWTYETLGPGGAGVVSRPAWDALTAYLGECGYLLKRDRTRTRWADGVTYEQYLEATRLSFPRAFPAGPAPTVRVPINAAQSAQTRTDAQITAPAQ